MPGDCSTDLVRMFTTAILSMRIRAMYRYNYLFIVIIILQTRLNSSWLAGIDRFFWLKKKSFFSLALTLSISRARRASRSNAYPHLRVNPESLTVEPKITTISYISSRLAIGRFENTDATRNPLNRDRLMLATLTPFQFKLNVLNLTENYNSKN